MNIKYDKNDILLKGIRLIQEKGYANTGIQDILRACGIPKGSFYNFYSSKEAFALEAIALYSKLIIKFLEDVDSNEELSAENKIRTFFSKASSLHKSKECDKNCLFLSLASEVSMENKVFSEPITSNFLAYKEYIIKWITQAQLNNKIKKELNPVELANVIYDAYHGAIIRMKYQLNTKPLDDFMNYSLETWFK